MLLGSWGRRRKGENVEEWLRNKNTIEFLGIWEEMYNPNFNSPEFEGIRNEAGLNKFILSVKQWTEKTNSIGIIAKAGRYGGTYAHKDIAFEFASWVSLQFKLYLIKEFDRLKTQEQAQIGWSVKRELAKLNYHIHTDAIKQNLIPPELSPQRISYVYSEEADVLNVALFGRNMPQGIARRFLQMLQFGGKKFLRDFNTISVKI